MARTPKLENLIDRVREYVDAGRYQLTRHADRRMNERDILLPEALHVLKTGWHEKAKDQYQKQFDNWKYAIRSQTVDDRSLRVIVAFDDDRDVVVITVVDLDK